jgi:hypothetical protein
MMTPLIFLSDLQRVLKTLAPEVADPFPHLASQTPGALLRRKFKIAQVANRLEQLRYATEIKLLAAFHVAHPHFDGRATGYLVRR